MSTLRYINKLTGEIVEETINGCSCQSNYAKKSEYINLNKLTIEEINSIINSTKTKVITKTVEISSDILQELHLN